MTLCGGTGLSESRRAVMMRAAVMLAVVVALGSFTQCAAAQQPQEKRDDLDVTMQIIVDPDAKLPDEVVRRIPLPTRKSADQASAAGAAATGNSNNSNNSNNSDNSGNSGKSDKPDKSDLTTGKERNEAADEQHSKETSQAAHDRAREASDQREAARRAEAEERKKREHGPPDDHPKPPNRPPHN